MVNRSSSIDSRKLFFVFVIFIFLIAFVVSFLFLDEDPNIQDPDEDSGIDVSNESDSEVFDFCLNMETGKKEICYNEMKKRSEKYD